MTKIRLSILFSLLILLSPVLAQPYCEVRTFNIRDGLAGNVISGITEDKNHLMWFTTWNGLCYYDGYQFTTFRDMRGSNRILTTNRMLHLFSDENGNVWTTTYDLRVCMFDTKKCQFVDVSAILKEHYGLDVTTSKFMRGAKGTVWAKVDGDNSVVVNMDGNLIGKAQGMDIVRFDKGRMKGAKVERVSVDQHDREWIFTDKGVCTRDMKVTITQHYDNLLAIGDKVYFYSSDGLLGLYDEHTSKMKVMLSPQGLHFNKVRTMGDQRLVVATDRGLFIYDLRTGSRRLVSVQNPAQPRPEVTDLYLDSKNRVWAFGKGPGVTLLDMTTLKVKWMNREDANCRFVTDEESMFFHEDLNHTIWVMPNQGAFCYFDEKTAELQPYALQLKGSAELRNMTIRKYFKDSQGNVWIAGNHDLALLNFKYRQFKFVKVEGADCEVRSVKTLSNGNMLLGTANGYVQVLDAKKQSKGYLTASGGLSTHPAKLTDCKVMAIMEDRSHRVWIGTRGDGIYLLDGAHISHYTKGDGSGLSSNDVFDFCTDALGRIWLSTWKGGICLVGERGGKLRFLSADNGLKGYPLKAFPQVRRLTMTRDGVMIGSGSTGIITFSTKHTNPAQIKYYGQYYDHNDTTTLATGDVMQTCVMRNGRIFVATLGGSIQELVSRNLLQPKLKFAQLKRSKQNIVEGMALSMIEDRRGRLWVAHESDISLYDPHTKSLQQYGPNYLGDNRELSEAKPDINPQTGEIAFGALGGIVVFNPDNVRNSSYVPRIVFTSIQYQGDETEHPILNTPELYVAHDKRNFNINFAALDYTNNYMVKYAYKLEGVDKEWNYPGSHLHSASYSNFPAGHYRLLVRSTNADGVWTDNVAVLNIYAQPTFWETIWAKILYVVLLLAVLYSVKRYYEMRNKTRTLHAMVNQLLEEYNNRSVQAQESEEKQRQDSPEIYHLPPSEILDSDQQMMMKLMDFLSQNIGNSELKIDELADAVNLSRSVFYSKLKAKVGMTPVEFLKHIRIQKAEELIVRSSESFSQIAYAVGFTDPKYFTKCFKKATGMTPSEYRSSKKE